MSIISVPEQAKPAVKSHHKARHLKKFALGPFAETCVEFRFSQDIEQFDALDEALTALQMEQGWDLFIAYFNNQFHVAVTYFTEQGEVEAVVAAVSDVLAKIFGQAPELTVLAGDANYGDWEGSYHQE
ncbi:hypothetical protein [Ferrimonas balearica]|uniref:hypothetical protein n=1 Tax=Ferrimonas balearica TaxID=44012 RepID=UPI001C996305|nr:hypothetical protein [Ferrimonas balearica]MBY5922950.1 hypothetical protein [Ferrimonas balearica]MBY5997673.1 hypothetical protein [Ferrimonas balearica]